MGKTDSLEMNGTVIKVNPSSRFDVELDDNKMIVDCTISGKLRMNKIRILNGDSVVVEISPYDLTKGRIVWRNK